LSSYLHIAEQVLSLVRRPLTPRSILREAYLLGAVPKHLHGKTQHKTLQARLSEDILRKREQSAFFRTKPGHFFLRRFLTDASIPVEFRQPVTARRRTRDLLRGPALAIHVQTLKEAIGTKPHAEPHLLKTIMDGGHYEYINPKKQVTNQALLWAVATLTKANKVLCYRSGKYRDDRDQFAQKRCVSFSSLVLESDRTFFDLHSFGIENSAFAAVAVDLDISLTDYTKQEAHFSSDLKFIARSDAGGSEAILAFVEVKAPEWYEPAANRLSLNNVHWLDLSVPPNNIDDFDPWSQVFLCQYFSRPRVSEQK